MSSWSIMMHHWYITVHLNHSQRRFFQDHFGFKKSSTLWRSTRTWRSRLWEKCLLVYHTLFYRSLGEHMSNTWDDLDLSGGFQRCERGQVKRTFVVNGFGDHPLESCYCTQYYCWWLFYPALAIPLIGSYFSHGCVHSKCSTKSWILLNKVHFTHLGSIYFHCFFGVWHFVSLLRSGTFAWSHKLIFWKTHIAYQTPDFWQVNEIVWLLLKTTTTERFRSRQAPRNLSYLCLWLFWSELRQLLA